MNLFPGFPAYVAAYYPGTTLLQINGTTTDLFRAVLNTSVPCAGAIAPDVSIAYWLGPEGDPAKSFCTLQTVRSALNREFMPLENIRSGICPPSRGCGPAFLPGWLPP